MSGFWDNLMRKKGLFLFLVAIFSIISLSSYNILYRISRSSSSAALDDLNISEKPVSGYQNSLKFTIGSSLIVTFDTRFTTASLKVTQDHLNNPAFLEIRDKSGRLIASEQTVLVETDEQAETAPTYVFNPVSQNYNVSLQPGYKITFSSPETKVYSTLSNKLATNFMPKNTAETYVVAEFGLQKTGWDIKRSQTEMYSLVRDYFATALAEYQAKVPKDVLYNKNLDTESKSQALVAFYQLREADQAQFRELIDGIKRGGSPEITYFGEMSYKKGEKVDLASLVNILDAEDGKIERVTVTTNLDFNRAGTYDVTYSTYDSDHNSSNLTVKIEVEESATSPSYPNQDESSGNGQIAEGWGPIGSLLPNSIATMGSGNGSDSNNVANSDSTLSQDINSTLADEAEDSGLKNEAPVDLITNDFGTNKNHTDSDASSNSDQKEAEKSRGLKVWQIGLAAVGVLVILGLIRFISDHYVR